MKLSEVFNLLHEMDYKSELVRDSEFSIIGPERKSSINSLRYLSELKYLDSKICKSAALLVREDIYKNKLFPNYNGGLILCKDAKECFFAIHKYLYENTQFFGNTFQTKIDKSVKIGKNAVISKENVMIGKKAIIGDNVVIESNVEIGDYTNIGHGTILGAETVELVRIKGRRIILPHAGKLKIGKNVIIMNNSVISKGITPWYNTVIYDGVVIGSCVTIAHGNSIGSGTLIIDNSMIAGHCDLGKNVWIGPQSVVKNRIKIGNNVRIALGAVVIEDVPDNTQISGFFAIERLVSLKHYKDLKLGKYKG